MIARLIAARWERYSLPEVIAGKILWATRGRCRKLQDTYTDRYRWAVCTRLRFHRGNCKP